MLYKNKNKLQWSTTLWLCPYNLFRDAGRFPELLVLLTNIKRLTYPIRHKPSIPNHSLHCNHIWIVIQLMMYFLVTVFILNKQKQCT